jgi:hypothetical protein
MIYVNTIMMYVRGISVVIHPEDLFHNKLL